MSDPEDRRELVTSLCSWGPRPIVIDGMFRVLLASHFQDADNLEHPEFRERLFKSTDDTGILIEDALVWKPTTGGKRLAVTIARGEWSFIKRGTLDNTSGLTPEGNREHCKLGRGMHTLNCIAKAPAEADVLAAEVYRFLMHFGPAFRFYFQLHWWELLQCGKCRQMLESKDHYVVPVTVGYAWAENWVLVLDAPVIKTIRLSEIFSTWPTSET